MTINRITVYGATLHYDVLSRARANVKTLSLDDTIVAIEDDSGTIGYGEACPLAPTYLPMLVGSTRAALDVIAPKLLGLEPRGINAVYAAMNTAALGFSDAKSAVDMACWDLFGKLTGLPLHTLLGGRQCDHSLLYRSIPFDEASIMAQTLLSLRSAGYRRFQIKVGGEVEEDIERIRAVTDLLQPGERAFADANRGWLVDDALRVVNALKDVDVIIEQPCATHEECVAVRSRSPHTFLLDEIIDNNVDLMRAIGDRLIDALVVKLTHVGGLTPALDMVRLCASVGIRVRIEDTVGTQLSNAAVAHLAAATASRHLLASYVCPDYGVTLGEPGTHVVRGLLYVSDSPGLGVQIDESTLGDPLAEWRIN